MVNKVTKIGFKNMKISNQPSSYLHIHICRDQRSKDTFSIQEDLEKKRNETWITDHICWDVAWITKIFVSEIALPCQVTSCLLLYKNKELPLYMALASSIAEMLPPYTFQRENVQRPGCSDGRLVSDQVHVTLENTTRHIQRLDNENDCSRFM